MNHTTGGIRQRRGVRNQSRSFHKNVTRRDLGGDGGSDEESRINLNTNDAEHRKYDNLARNIRKYSYTVGRGDNRMQV